MMMTNEKMKINGCTPIEDLITEDFGAIGTPERDEFERGCEAFIIGERLKAGMTQEQLAAKIGTKKAIFLALRMDMPTYNCLLFLKYSKDRDEK